MKRTIFSTGLLFFISMLQAQQDTSLILPEENDYQPRAFLDVIPEIEIGFPIGDFKEKINHSALGGTGIGFYYRMKRHPVDVGIRFSGMTYDKIRRNFDQTSGGQEGEFVQKTKNKIWFWYGAVHFEPPVHSSLFQPYLEGTAGLQRFFTKTYSKERGLSITFPIEDTQTNSRFDKKKLHSDWGWTFSGAAGLKIIFDQKYGSAIDLQIGYQWGVASDFYVKKGIWQVQEEPLDNFELRRSALTMVSFKIRFSFLLFEYKDPPIEIGTGSGAGIFEKAGAHRSHVATLHHSADVGCIDGTAHQKKYGGTKNR